MRENDGIKDEMTQVLYNEIYFIKARNNNATRFFPIPTDKLPKRIH